MNLTQFKKLPLLWLYLGGAILLVIALVLWCVKVSTDQERVFWQTINQGMATHGVTIVSEQSNSGTSVSQKVRYSVGAANLSHSLTTQKQAGTTVKNEMLGTPTTDYARYLTITTDQKKPDGTPLDFSKALSVWTEIQEEGNGQSFSQAVFGTSVPIGYVNSERRAELMQQVRNDGVYQIDFKKTKKERVNGRLRYTYDAMVQPAAYAAFIKAFAQSIGLHGLDQLQPDDYKAQKPFKLLIAMDVKSHHVVSIESPDSGGKQTYTAYDVPVQIDVPKQAISRAELQKRIDGAR